MFSIELNKVPNCLNNMDEVIQNDFFKFSYKKQNEYILSIKKKIENEILLVVSFNFSEEINNINIDISLNEKYIGTLKSGNPKQIISWPYHLVYIKAKKFNLFDKNNIKLQFTGTPNQCLKKTISSLHVFELEK